MEKYIYWRNTSGLSGDQDETSGSVMYPVSHILGISAGDGSTDAEGAITDDDNRFTIYLKPMRAAFADNTTGAGADRPDWVVFDTSGGDTDFRLVFEELVGTMNSNLSNGMITLFDGVTGTGLSAITGIHGSQVQVRD